VRSGNIDEAQRLIATVLNGLYSPHGLFPSSQFRNSEFVQRTSFEDVSWLGALRCEAIVSSVIA
jgi:hypothetical protein